MQALLRAFLCISIHAPRTGSDVVCRECAVLRGISIHAPRTGSDPFATSESPGVGISIHAPRTGSDEFDAYVVYGDIIFQSTLPARGATTWFTP